MTKNATCRSNEGNNSDDASRCVCVDCVYAFVCPCVGNCRGDRPECSVKNERHFSQLHFNVVVFIY